MKRILQLLLMLVLSLTFLGCGRTEQEPIWVYSVHGEDALISVTNGVMVLGEENDVFHGGDLRVAEEVGTGVVSYTMGFYFLLDGEREDFLRMALVNAGDIRKENGPIGNISGSGVFHNEKICQKPFDSWKDAMFFELTTEDLSGSERVYTLPMTITEVTG